MLRVALAALVCFFPQDSLRDLDSPDPAVARRAFEAAIKAGDEKALAEAAKSSERASRALNEVQSHRRFGDAYPPVSTFTLSIKDLSIEAAMAELAKAMGVKVEEPNKWPAPPGTPEKFSVEIKDAYFLEAMDLFAAASKTYLWLDGDGIKLSRFSPPSGPKFYWRTFVFVADSLQEQRTVNSFGANLSSSLEIRMMIAGTPRLAGINRVVVHEARDDRGADLRTDKQPPDPWKYQAFMVGSQYPIQVGLKGVPPEAKTLTVRGEVEFIVPREPYTVDVNVGGETTAEGIKTSAVLEAGGDIQVTSTILDPQKPHIRPRAADLQVIGPDGSVLIIPAVLIGPPFAPVQTWKVAGAPKGSKLKVRHFKSVGDLSVPFEFRDIPLK